jgi:transposase
LFKPIVVVAPRQMESAEAYMARVAQEVVELQARQAGLFQRSRNLGGRPPKLTPEIVEAEKERRRATNKPASQTALARHFGVSKSTIYRCLKK